MSDDRLVDAEAFWAWQIDPAQSKDVCHFQACTNPASVYLRVSGRRASEVIRVCPLHADESERYDNLERIGRAPKAYVPEPILMDAPKEEQMDLILVAGLEGFGIVELAEKLCLAPHTVRAYVRELERAGLLIREGGTGAYMDAHWVVPDEF